MEYLNDFQLWYLRLYVFNVKIVEDKRTDRTGSPNLIFLRTLKMSISGDGPFSHFVIHNFDYYYFCQDCFLLNCVDDEKDSLLFWKKWTQMAKNRFDVVIFKQSPSTSALSI
jgi:hypothetical protein